MPRARGRSFALVAGAVTVGVVGQLAGAAPGVPHLATALGAPWLVAAFAAGGLLRRPVTGALGGAVLLAGGTLVYYLVRVALAPRLGIADKAAIAVGWAARRGARRRGDGPARRALAPLPARRRCSPPCPPRRSPARRSCSRRSGAAGRPRPSWPRS